MYPKPNTSERDNIVVFPRKCRPHVDIISEKVVNGMVLIEACVPVAVLKTLLRMLDAP